MPYRFTGTSNSAALHIHTALGRAPDVAIVVSAVDGGWRPNRAVDCLSRHLLGQQREPNRTFRVKYHYVNRGAVPRSAEKIANEHPL
jgi:hypothetical protein